MAPYFLKISTTSTCFSGYDGHTFKPNAHCVNIGSDKNHVWLPADKLTIVPDQMVSGLLNPKFTSSMVKAAEKRPLANEALMLSYALVPLGINSKQSFLRVSNFSHTQISY